MALFRSRPRPRARWRELQHTCAAILLASIVLSAQTNLSTLHGVVAAPTGVVVTDAVLYVTNVRTKAQKKVSTDRAGRYEVRIAPGAYRVTAETSGIRPFEVVVDEDQDVERDIELQVGGVSFRLGVSELDSPGTPFVSLAPMDRVVMSDDEKKEWDEWALRQPLQNPSPVYFVKPAYPEPMRERRREGRVSIRATIGTEGALTGVTITGDAAFVPATREAAGNWQFAPARVQGTPVPVPFQMELAFSLAGDRVTPTEGPAPPPLGVTAAPPH